MNLWKHPVFYLCNYFLKNNILNKLLYRFLAASISATVAKKPKLEPVGEKEKIIVKEEKKPVEIKKEPSRTTTTAIDKTKNTDKYNNNNRPVVDNKRSEEKKYDQKKTDAKIKLDFTEKKSSSGGSYRDKEAYVPRRYQK